MDDTTVISRSPDTLVAQSSRPARRRADSVKALRIDVSKNTIQRTRSPDAAAERRSGTVWLDYTDLVHYFEDNRIPTGIQRVQIGLFRASLARAPELGTERVAACSFDTQRRCWVAVPEALLASVCRAACQTTNGALAQGAVDEAWRALTAALRQSITNDASAPFAPGDVLVNVGSSWWIPDYLRFVHHLQRERGVLYAAFVHDCIPLRVPETCAAGLVEEFGTWFGETMRIADLVLANSAHTARDIALLAPGRCAHPPTPHVVRLDARFDDGPQPGPVTAARLDAHTHASLGIHRPFALFVATLEARKNHLFVFQCWQELIDRHGDTVPDLICVGKEGWLFDYTQNWLRVHPKLAGRVRLAGTLSDHDVAALYRTAQFTVYCSHYEGWGLPITESLCYGRVPVAPSHTSLPEAGGDFAVYYEPGSAEGFCDQVERLMNRGHRGVLEARIRTRYRPRAWSDVLAQMVSTVRQAPLRSTVAPSTSVIRSGCLYTFARRRGDLGIADALESGERFKHGIGWHSAEEWGCWSRLPQAQLLLALPERLRNPALYFVLRCGPAEQLVQIAIAGIPSTTMMIPSQQRRLARMVPDPRRSGSELLVRFSSSPYSLLSLTDGRDLRDIGFGLEMIVLADRRDVQMRLELLELFLTSS